MVNNLIVIPEFSTQELAELKKKIRPVVAFTPEYVRHSSPRTLLYVDPNEKQFFWGDGVQEVAHNLVTITLVTTYHRFIKKTRFEPTATEFLTQIPLRYRDKVVAYEVAVWPQTAIECERQPKAVLEQGFHEAIICLYAQA